MSNALEDRIARLEKTVTTLAAWLVEAQTGFGEHDYRAIKKMNEDSQDQYQRDLLMRAMEEE